MSPEHQEGRELQEQPPALYYRAERFRTERPADRAYFAAQEAIFRAQCDLSSFRFQLNAVWHVAILRAPPPGELEHRLRLILAAGEPVALPEEVLQLLRERRAQAIQ